MRSIAIVAVSAVLAAVGLSTAPPGSAHTATVNNPFIELQPPAMCGHCHDAQCGGPGHDFHEQDPYPKDGQDHSCIPVECGGGQHPDCSASENALAITGLDSVAKQTREILALLPQAMVESKSLNRLLRTHPSRVHFNRERKRLQVSAPCSPEMVIAQIPMSESQIRAASAEDHPRQ